MDRHNGLGFGVNHLFDFVLINARMVAAAVHKTDIGSPEGKCIGSRNKSVGRNDDLIARLYPEEQCSQFKRIGAGGGQQDFGKSVSFLHPLVGFFGKNTITADFAGKYSLIEVMGFLAREVWFVEWNHLII